MTIINKTKIDWCTHVWNPVWGCKNKCEYCYARKIAYRFADNIVKKEYKFKFDEDYIDKNQNPGIMCCFYEQVKRLKNFEPTWLESNYQKSFPKKPAIIFVNSMSDPAYWEQSWYEKIVKKIAKNMQHTFIILTKQPEVYKKYTFPHNVVLGVTINTYEDWNQKVIAIQKMQDCKNKLLISIEPIQNTFSKRFTEMLSEKFDWIIVGPETGNRIDKYICTPEMLDPFFDLNIPVFMKNACAKITDKPLRQEWPERGYDE